MDTKLVIIGRLVAEIGSGSQVFMNTSYCTIPKVIFLAHQKF
jgi:hypothetical protein